MTAVTVNLAMCQFSLRWLVLARAGPRWLELVRAGSGWLGLARVDLGWLGLAPKLAQTGLMLAPAGSMVTVHSMHLNSTVSKFVISSTAAHQEGA